MEGVVSNLAQCEYRGEYSLTVLPNFIENQHRKVERLKKEKLEWSLKAVRQA